MAERFGARASRLRRKWRLVSMVGWSLGQNSVVAMGVSGILRFCLGDDLIKLRLDRIISGELTNGDWDWWIIIRPEKVMDWSLGRFQVVWSCTTSRIDASLGKEQPRTRDYEEQYEHRQRDKLHQKLRSSGDTDCCWYDGVDPDGGCGGKVGTRLKSDIWATVRTDWYAGFEKGVEWAEERLKSYG